MNHETSSAASASVTEGAGARPPHRCALPARAARDAPVIELGLRPAGGRRWPRGSAARFGGPVIAFAVSQARRQQPTLRSAATTHVCQSDLRGGRLIWTGTRAQLDRAAGKRSPGPDGYLGSARPQGTGVLADLRMLSLVESRRARSTKDRRPQGITRPEGFVAGAPPSSGGPSATATSDLASLFGRRSIWRESPVDET